MAAVQAALPRSAKRSLLSRQAPQADTQQQQQQLMRQQQPVASSPGAVVDLQPPSQRLAAIPEAAEESMAQEVPLDFRHDNADGQASARPDETPLYTAAPADAVLAPASAASDQAAAQQQHISAEQVESLHGLASPRMMDFQEHPRSLGGSVSRTERHQRASYLGHPAAAPAAGQEGVSEAAAPLSLLQLAAAPAAQQQLPSPSILASVTHRQSAAQHAKHVPKSVAHPAMSPQPSAAVDGKQDVSSSNADMLQGLQASLVQTVTTTVESAMMQMRWVSIQRPSTRVHKLRSWPTAWQQDIATMLCTMLLDVANHHIHWPLTGWLPCSLKLEQVHSHVLPEHSDLKGAWLFCEVCLLLRSVVVGPHLLRLRRLFPYAQITLLHVMNLWVVMVSMTLFVPC